LQVIPTEIYIILITLQLLSYSVGGLCCRGGGGGRFKVPSIFKQPKIKPIDFPDIPPFKGPKVSVPNLSGFKKIGGADSNRYNLNLGGAKGNLAGSKGKLGGSIPNLHSLDTTGLLSVRGATSSTLRRYASQPQLSRRVVSPEVSWFNGALQKMTLPQRTVVVEYLASLNPATRVANLLKLGGTGLTYGIVGAVGYDLFQTIKGLIKGEPTVTPPATPSATPSAVSAPLSKEISELDETLQHCSLKGEEEELKFDRDCLDKRGVPLNARDLIYVNKLAAEGALSKLGEKVDTPTTLIDEESKEVEKVEESKEVEKVEKDGGGGFSKDLWADGQF
jgi:hypothetical protein